MDFYKLPIAKDGFIYIITLMIFSVLLYFVFFFSFYSKFVSITFCYVFLRNPERKIPYENNIIVSTADEHVMSVDEIIELDFIMGKAIRVYSEFIKLIN